MRININIPYEMKSEMMKQMYQDWANSMVEKYDFRDVQRAIKHAESMVPRIKPQSLDEMDSVLRELFQTATNYLLDNCEEI